MIRPPFPFSRPALMALCAIVAGDAWQRAPDRVIHSLRPRDPGPPNAASIQVLRTFLRHLYPVATTPLDRPRRIP